MTTAVNSVNAYLAKLDAAFKAVTDISDFGDSVLQPQKFDQFVRRMEDKAVVLSEARMIPMDSDIVDIDRTGFIGRILRSGSDAAGASRELESSEFAQTSQATNKLTAKELQAVTSIRDRALRRNIEKGNFENTLLDLFGEAAGRDFEEFALLGDTEWTHAQDDVLSKTDGWVKGAGNHVFGVGGSADFDPADVEEMLEAMLDALPKRFLQNVTDWRFLVPFSVLNAYRAILIARGTALGDEALVDGLPVGTLPYKGIPVMYAPLIERSANATSGKVSGRLSLLTHPDNMAWGVFHEVSIEREREAKAKRTDFVLTFEGDVSYEDEDGAVAAFLDLDSSMEPAGT